MNKTTGIDIIKPAVLWFYFESDEPVFTYTGRPITPEPDSITAFLSEQFYVPTAYDILSETRVTTYGRRKEQV